jgi:hypothetical protein
MNCERMETVNAMSRCMLVVAYISDPIARWYGMSCMSSVSSCVDGDCSDERLAPTFIGISSDSSHK